MAAPPSLTFGAFRLDLETEKLLRGVEVLRLGPKAFGVLRRLVERSGEVVRRDDLLRAVWPDTHVGPAVLKTAILEIRRALGDDTAAPRFVETVPRVGYRFVAPPPAQTPAAPRKSTLLGRDAVLEQLERHLAQARAGRRQVVLVAGEAGVGKTTLLEAFVAGLADDPEVRVAWGGCLEHHGVAEDYLPVLDALGRLCRAPGRERVLDLLATHAPTWLASLPAALRERDVSARELLGSTPERMLREMADVLLVMSTEKVLVLVLEDLHWSDYATLDLVTMLARSPDPARLLVLGSYRPVDASAREHPLRGVVRELRARAACEEIALGYLTSRDVAAYLDARFPGHSLPAQLATVVHRRSDGNALFLVRLVDELLATSAIVDDGEGWRLARPLGDVARIVPPTIGGLIEQQVQRLDAQGQLVLETASLVGRDFAAAMVADALEVPTSTVEELCDALARQGSLLAPAPVGALPDGTPLPRYRFTHALYPEVLARRVPDSRRLRTHARLAEWLERTHAADLDAVAAECAHHHEQAHEWREAIASLRRAAAEEARRCASQEAIARLRHACELASRLVRAQADRVWPELLYELGLTYRSAGDRVAAADSFRRLVAWGVEHGDAAWQARALLRLASVLSWDDPGASQAASRASVALVPQVDDPVLRLQLEADAAFWRLHDQGWRAEDADLVKKRVETIRASSDRRWLSHALLPLASFQGTRGQLVAAARTASEGIEAALVAGDAHECLACQCVLAGALRRQGLWADAMRVLDDGSQLAVRSGHALWALALRMLRAMLHLDALDFAGAEQIAREAYDDAPIDYLRVDAASVLGLALLGSGRIEEASAVLSAPCGGLGDDFTMRGMGRPWRLEGLASLALARGEVAEARTHAEALAERAHALGDPISRALATRLLGEVALHEARAADALRHADEGLRMLLVTRCPTAEWPLHALAGRAYAASGALADAEASRRCAASLVARIAASLPGEDALRRSLAVLAL